MPFTLQKFFSSSTDDEAGSSKDENQDNLLEPPPYTAVDGVSSIPEWNDRINSVMTHEEFSEFFVETIAKYNDHFLNLTHRKEIVTVNVIEGFSNLHTPVTVCTKLGELDFRLKWNASQLCIPTGNRGEFDIFLLIANYGAPRHLKCYSMWSESIRKSKPHCPIIFLRTHSATNGNWVAGISPKLDQDIFKDCAANTTMQVDISIDGPQDSSNKLYKLLTRVALLQYMNSRPTTILPESLRHQFSGMPVYEYIKVEWLD